MAAAKPVKDSTLGRELYSNSNDMPGKESRTTPEGFQLLVSAMSVFLIDEFIAAHCKSHNILM